MKCPRCSGKTGRVQTEDAQSGQENLDYIVACYVCAWQCSLRTLEAWLVRFGYRKKYVKKK